MASVISLFLDYKVGRRLSAQLSNQVGKFNIDCEVLSAIQTPIVLLRYRENRTDIWLSVIWARRHLIVAIGSKRVGCTYKFWEGVESRARLACASDVDSDWLVKPAVEVHSLCSRSSHFFVNITQESGTSYHKPSLLKARMAWPSWNEELPNSGRMESNFRTPQNFRIDHCRSTTEKHFRPYGDIKEIWILLV